MEALRKMGFSVSEVGRQLLIVFVRFSMSIIFLGIILGAYGWCFYWIQEWFNVIYLRSLGLFFLQLDTKIVTVAMAAFQGSYTFPAGLTVPLAPIVVAVGLVGIVGPFKQPHKLFLQLYAVNLGGAAFLAVAAIVIRLFQPTPLPQAWVAYGYLALVAVVLFGCLIILPVELFRKTYRWQGDGITAFWGGLGSFFNFTDTKKTATNTQLEHRIGSPDPYDIKIGKLLLHQLQVDGILLTGVAIPYKKDSIRYDNILLCDRGIFVIEGKNYTGTIRGDTNSSWQTHTGSPIKSSRGENPLQQCDKQVMALKNFFAEYAVFVNGAVVFPSRASFALDHVQINTFPYSTAVPVFNESALVDAINKHRPPIGKSVPPQTVLRQMADRIMKV